MENIKTDVLIIGGGGAGCRAAIEASETAATVTMAVKGVFGRIGGLRGSGATGATDSFGFISNPQRGRYVVGGAGGAATLEEEQQIFYKLGMEVGLGMADSALMKILVDEAPTTKQRLKSWGVIVEDMPPFLRCYVAPNPGLACVVRGTGKIQVLDHIMVTNLIIRNGICAGAIGINELSGDVIIFDAKATILATGGAGQLYRHHFQPLCVTGDGYALGYEAGAQLLNMEFQQIIWAIIYPTTVTLPLPDRPQFLNANGNEFVQNYLPAGLALDDIFEKKLQHWPFTSRDISKYLDIAAVKETKAGKATEHGGFYIKADDILKARHKPFREILEWCETHGIDLGKEFLEANLCYHCQNGGLRIDEQGQTTVPHLYAVGETAAGPYGVDRIGGCMMAFSQVFGARAGRHAATISAKKDRVTSITDGLIGDEVEKINNLKRSQGKIKPIELRKKLQKIAWENLLVVKSEESLHQFLNTVSEIRNELTHNIFVNDASDLVQALELSNLLKTGEIIATAANERKESRGNHYRDDYQERDDSKWAHSIIVKKLNDEMKLDKVNRDLEWSTRNSDVGNLKWG